MTEKNDKNILTFERRARVQIFFNVLSASASAKLSASKYDVQFLIFVYFQVRNDRELGPSWNVALGKIKWLTAQSKENPITRLRDTCIAFKDLRKSNFDYYYFLNYNCKYTQTNLWKLDHRR